MNTVHQKSKKPFSFTNYDCLWGLTTSRVLSQPQTLLSLPIKKSQYYFLGKGGKVWFKHYAGPGGAQALRRINNQTTQFSPSTRESPEIVIWQSACVNCV